MAAALKLTQDDEKLSRKPPLGEKRPKLRLVWENPELSHGTQKEKPEVKPEPSYGRVLYNYFRDYDPSAGRYVESDPAGLSGGLNMFAYAFNVPIYLYDSSGLSPRDVTRINERFNEVVDEMTENNKRHPNKHWNNFCRYWGIPGCENYENCEGQTVEVIEELNKLKPDLDDEWSFDVEHNFEIKPWWYPGHNWVRGTSKNLEDPSLWFDPRAGKHGAGHCEQCY